MNNYHIDTAYDLYKNLLDYKSDFICNGIEDHLSHYLFKDNNIGHFLFLYLYNEYARKKNELIHDNKIEISLPNEYKNVLFSIVKNKIFISCVNCYLKISLKSDHTTLYKELNLEAIKDENDKFIIIDFFIALVQDLTGKSSSRVEIEKFPLQKKERNEIVNDTLIQLYKYIRLKYKNINWYNFGIDNLACKIFNELVLSFTQAEYLRIKEFTRKLQDFEKYFSRNNWDIEIEEEIIPQLTCTVLVMIARYQLFCRQVESQLVRRPDELYFCLERDIETELATAFPLLVKAKIQKDTSKKFINLFGAILDIGFTDHRFILEQQTVERLVYALELIKNAGEKYFKMDDSSWQITTNDLNELAHIEQYTQRRSKATKLVLQLVYAKGCTLIHKIALFLQTSSYSEKTVPYSLIKIIERKNIKNLKDIIHIYPCSLVMSINDSTCNNAEKTTYTITEDDIDRYNKQTIDIHNNHNWFKTQEKLYHNYEKLTIDNVTQLYNEYRNRKGRHNTDTIIFFSEKFLVAALDTVEKSINDQLNNINSGTTENNDLILKKVYQSLKLFRELIDEMLKLAEFSEKFGLMEDQHLFENSFYAAQPNSKSPTEKSIYKRKHLDNKLSVETEIAANWIFMASTHYPPAYPNHYKRLYKKYDDERRELSNKLYMELPSFLNKRSQQEISKERNNNIQIMAIFATIMAFVTASVGALKILETTTGYIKFSAIFSLSLLSFVLVIRLFSKVSKIILLCLIGMALCIWGIALINNERIQMFLCSILAFIFVISIFNIRK